MPQEEAIKYVSINLEVPMHEWWYDGMVTFGHNQITSYEKFTKRLIERFDTKDPKL